MDDDIRALREALDRLEHWAVIIGRTQARKESGDYSEADARIEQCAHEATAKCRARLLGEAEEMPDMREEIRFLKAEVERLRAERDALKEDAERWRWGVKHAAWYRNEERAHIAIPVAADADLSCVAMRVAAVDAARREKT